MSKEKRGAKERAEKIAKKEAELKAVAEVSHDKLKKIVQENLTKNIAKKVIGDFDEAMRQEPKGDRILIMANCVRVNTNAVISDNLRALMVK